MWVRTLDDELLNLRQAETIEVVPSYGGEALLKDVGLEEEDEPEEYELVAFLASGEERTLFKHEDEAAAQAALELLAQLIGAQDLMDGFAEGRALSLSDLLEEEEDDKN